MIKTAYDHEEISTRNRKAQEYIDRKEEENSKKRASNLICGLLYVILLYSIMIWFS